MEDRDRSRERFEQLWDEQKYVYLQADEGWQRVKESYKMRTWSDYVLFAVPLVVGVLALDFVNVEREFLRWALCAVAVLVAFVVCTWLKTAFGGAESAVDVERRVKERCFRHFVETGSLGGNGQ